MMVDGRRKTGKSLQESQQSYPRFLYTVLCTFDHENQREKWRKCDGM
jgi:hypothetical protein